MFLILVCKFINIFFPQYYLNGCFYLSPSYWNMLFSFIVFFQVILLKFKTHCRLLSFVCFYLSPSYWNMYAFFHSLLSSRWFFVIQNPLQTKFCLFLSVILIETCMHFSFIVIFQMIFIIQNPLQTYSYMFKFCPFRWLPLFGFWFSSFLFHFLCTKEQEYYLFFCFSCLVFSFPHFCHG